MYRNQKAIHSEPVAVKSIKRQFGYETLEDQVERARKKLATMPMDEA